MLKIQSKVEPDNIPSLEEWLKEMNCGKTHSRFQKGTYEEQSSVELDVPNVMTIIN